MNGYAPTPRLTAHARLRCQQMGVSTRKVKEILRNPSTIYPGPTKHGENYVALSALHTDLAVAFKVIDGIPTALTVLWHRAEEYVREPC